MTMQATEKATSSISRVPDAFEPRIVAFVCKWCTYAGADLAGTSRMTYPPNVRTIMLPCTGRIDVSFVVRAFLQGADGVIVSGCHPGDCHYNAGNFRARRRWTLFRDLLDTLGVDLDRLAIAWISAAEGVKWVKMIQDFTDAIRKRGPYHAMHSVAADHLPPPVPNEGGAPVSFNHPAQAAPADPALISSAADALDSGKLKAVIGWRRNSTLGRAHPIWITRASDARQFCAPDAAANLSRMLKTPALKGVAPLGIVARGTELMALNVLVQEAQLDPKRVQVLVVDVKGAFLGIMGLEAACEKVLLQPAGDGIRDIDGFSPQTLAALDELMTKTPAERWNFWAQQSARCIRCYACRGACPMCTCDQCIMDKNQPQWFATAADGGGNLSWQIIRAFHLAGRCIGCGACQNACPAGIPLNILGAAMARSALKHFKYRAGADVKAPPLQADFRHEDAEEFIL